MKKQNTMSRCKMPFPWKLYQMLEDAEEQEHSKIISWAPDGRSFRIHNVNAFTQTVMKHYFRQKHFRSFTRQLYIYGFSKARCPSRIKEPLLSLDAATCAPDPSCYAHPDFIRGDKASCLSLERNQGQVQYPYHRVSVRKQPTKNCNKAQEIDNYNYQPSLAAPSLPCSRDRLEQASLISIPDASSEGASSDNQNNGNVQSWRDAPKTAIVKPHAGSLPTSCSLPDTHCTSLWVLASLSTTQLPNLLEPRPIEEMVSDGHYSCSTGALWIENIEARFI